MGLHIFSAGIENNSITTYKPSSVIESVWEFSQIPILRS